MSKNGFYLGLCLAFLLISACESKEKYSELEAALSETRAKLEQKSRQVQELELKLRKSEESWNKGQEEAAELQARYENLEKAGQQLTQTLKETRLELEKKNSIVQQKEEAIQELDKTKRQFESDLTELKELNAVQKQKIIEQRKIIAELDATRLTIEGTLQDHQSQLEARGKKIKDLESTIAKLDQTKQRIETSLQKQIKAQQVKLEEMEGKLKVTFVDKILFYSGSAKINRKGMDALSALTESFEQYKNHTIVVKGHTDNVLIKPEFREIYPTNWELSAARSTAVVRYLQEKAGVEPERLAACGYSFYQPISSNLTEEGQRQNRRIEIILSPSR
jgi:chemotaxis protein MotB